MPSSPGGDVPETPIMSMTNLRSIAFWTGSSILTGTAVSMSTSIGTSAPDADRRCAMSKAIAPPMDHPSRRYEPPEPARRSTLMYSADNASSDVSGVRPSSNPGDSNP